MDIGVLGPLIVSHGPAPTEISGLRQRRLLAVLVANVGNVVSTDRLAEAVFEGEPSRQAGTTIRSYVARLRRALSTREVSGSELIRTGPHGYALQLDESSIDAHRFLRGFAAGRKLLEERDARGAATVLQDALDLWRGDAYEEFAGEEWARLHAAHLDEKRVVAEEELVKALLACGDADEVVPRLRRLIVEQPLRERPRRQLMMALYRAGRQAEALRAFGQYRDVLSEIGLQPSDEIVRLDRNIARQDPALLTDASAGRTLRGYRLLSEIGRGSHGVVHRAVQPGVDRHVAVKTIRAELADDIRFVRQFDVEARVVAELEHPHVVPLYDYWREPGGAYLVMRLLAGDLSAQLDEGAMDVESVRRLAGQLGSALAAAHRAATVHGDIKPSNVLVDEEHNVYLSDFGVAALAGWPDDPPSASGYESPEQLRGERATAASDQFGLAMLILHALAGRPPIGPQGLAAPRTSLYEEIDAIALRRSVPTAVREVLRTSMASAPDDRFPDVAEFVDALETALGGRAGGVASRTPTANPYRGLRAFDELDAAIFFGRDEMVAELLATLSDTDGSGRFVTVIGASGSGKSSLVRAGLLPRLRAGAIEGSDDWLIATMSPGPDPVAALAAALHSIATSSTADVPVDEPDERTVVRLVDAAVPHETSALLVIDQFEELFTVTVDARVRRRFIEGLVAVVRSPVPRLRIVATLRADHFDRPLRSHALGELIRHGATAIVALSAEQLDATIRGPAATVGVDVEPALAARLVNDVIDRPAPLPLLQFALTELFERRSGSVMTLASYEAVGGVDAALADRADSVVDGLATEDLAAVRTMLLRLVTFDQDGSPTRRRVTRSELLAVGSDIARLEEVIDRLGAARLLTFDRDRANRTPTVELSHEALITHWPRLAAWVAASAHDLRTERHLEDAARAWDERGREDGDLYRGSRLDGAITWSDTHPTSLSDLQRAFLDAGRAQQTAEREAAERHLAEQQRANRKLRRRMIVLSIVLVVALGTGIAAVIAGSTAIDRRNAADAEAVRADSAAADARIRALTAESEAVRPDDPELAMLLALAALDVSVGEPFPAAEQALHEALLASRLIATVPGGRDGVTSFFPGGEAFVTFDESTLDAVVWNVDPLEARLRLPHPGEVVDAEVSRNGAMIATGCRCDDSTVRIWDAESGDLARELHFDAGMTSLVPAFSNDSTMVAASAQSSSTLFGVVKVWDADTGAELHSFRPPPGATVPLNVEFSPNDQYLAVTWFAFASERSGVRLWDLSSGEMVREFLGHESEVIDVDFTPEGDRIATASSDSTVKIWDVESGSELATYHGHDSPLRDVEVSPDGALVASAGFDVQVWRLDTLQPLDVIINHRDVDGLEFSPDSDRLLTSSNVHRTTKLWDLTPQGHRELLGLPAARTAFSTAPAVLDHPPGGLDIAPDGRRLAASRGDGRVSVWSLPDGDELTTLDGPGGEIKVVTYSADGTLLATGGSDGVTVWATDTYREVSRDGETTMVNDVEFRADGRAVLVAGADGVHEYELEGGRVVTHARDASRAATYSPDGRRVVVTTWPVGAALPVSFVTDADNGHWIELVRIDGIQPTFDTAADFRPDGSQLVLAGLDTAVVETSEVRASGRHETLTRYARHGNRVWDAEFAPDGGEVATAGGDGTIQIWDPRSGVARLQLSSGGATDLAYSADGRWLAALSPEGAVSVYAMHVDDLIAIAEERLSRDWTAEECVQYLQTETCPARRLSEGDPSSNLDAATIAPPEPDADRSGRGPGRDAGVADNGAAIELAETFLAAMNAHDITAATALLGTDAEFSMFDHRTPAPVDTTFRWLAASDWRFDRERCEQEDGDTVRCEVRQANAWSDALQIEPIDGSLRVDVEADEIRAIAYDFRIFAFAPDRYQQFLMFVAERNRDDGARMFAFGGGPPSFVVSAESIDLFRAYTAALLAST